MTKAIKMPTDKVQEFIKNDIGLFINNEYIRK
jgi:hypothetical protein